MHTSEIILIVTASIGLGAAVTMILLSPEYYYERIQSMHEIVGLVLGAAGIVIGGVIAYFQHKQTRRMDQIISSKDIREQRVKTEVLRRIRRNTMGMKTILIGTRFMIRNHIQDRNKHPWEKVSEGIRLDIGKAEKRRDEIIADIGRIALLIDDPRLITNFDVMYLTPVVLALKVLARPDYPTNIETMQRTWESLRYPIARLQEALRWIQTEMLGGEENIDRRTWRARVGRFFGPSPSRGTT